VSRAVAPLTASPLRWEIGCDPVFAQFAQSYPDPKSGTGKVSQTGSNFADCAVDSGRNDPIYSKAWVPRTRAPIASKKRQKGSGSRRSGVQSVQLRRLGEAEKRSLA
jgi:hypothetical protein